MIRGMNDERGGRRGEHGFALVVAILALLLLTFLGLTLAATSSTELQIAANHRWSQQAYYNAEAGLELGKRVLMNANWSGLLWLPRTTAPLATPTAPAARTDATGHASRNFESADCDTTGGNVGYGVVLDDGTALGPYQNVTSWPDAANVAWPLNGAVTLWIRWRLDEQQANGTFLDDPNAIVLTAEGMAPYRPAAGMDAASLRAVRANRAVRVLEVTLARQEDTPCRADQGQEGGGSTGSGKQSCEEITGLNGAAELNPSAR